MPGALFGCPFCVYVVQRRDNVVRHIRKCKHRPANYVGTPVPIVVSGPFPHDRYAARPVPAHPAPPSGDPFNPFGEGRSQGPPAQPGAVSPEQFRAYQADQRERERGSLLHSVPVPELNRPIFCPNCYIEYANAARYDKHLELCLAFFIANNPARFGRVWDHVRRIYPVDPMNLLPPYYPAVEDEEDPPLEENRADADGLPAADPPAVDPQAAAVDLLADDLRVSSSSEPSSSTGSSSSGPGAV